MVLTRPNVAFAVGCLARYISKPAIHYNYILKDLIKYLRLIINQRIRFGPGGDKHFKIFTDAD